MARSPCVDFEISTELNGTVQLNAYLYPCQGTLGCGFSEPVPQCDRTTHGRLLCPGRFGREQGKTWQRTEPGKREEKREEEVTREEKKYTRREEVIR